MPTFLPPYADTTPPIAADTRGIGYMQFRHYKNRACGRTVLKSEDGTYRTLDVPTQDQIDAAEIVYLGGHVYEIDDDEAAELTAAGYGEQIT